MNNLTKDYLQIVLDETPLIDVRSPIEYEKGAFLNAINLPILSDEERHLVGVCYKEQGNLEATNLGYNLVSGSIKLGRVQKWVEFINKHPDSILYCFRGGSRSEIAQKWIHEATDNDIYRIEGGYKAFRNYLIESLNPQELNCVPIIVSGFTGSGKTSLLNELPNSIDLEGLANHRGSSFGRYITPQPSQINFENSLAYKIIQHKVKGYKHIILEDEGKNVGKSIIPIDLASFFSTGNLVIIEEPFEKRVENTFNEYVVLAQKDYNNHYYIDGFNEWVKYIEESIKRLEKRLSGFNNIMTSFYDAVNYQRETGVNSGHIKWIEPILRDYYDPMYQYQIKKSTRKLLYKGTYKEVLEYLKFNYSAKF